MLSNTSNKVIASKIDNFKHKGYNNVKCISKELGYRNNRGTRRRECIPEFHPKGVRLVWRGVRNHNRLTATPQRLTFFSWWTQPQKVASSPSTIDPLWGGDRIPYNNLEAHTHNLIGGSQDDHKRSWPQKAGHKRRLGSKDPRVTSSQVLPPWILVEGSNRCKCNGKSTQSAQVLHSQIPTKQQMLMGE